MSQSRTTTSLITATAVALCLQALATFNEWPYIYMTLGAAYGYLGRAAEARAAVDRLLELIPGLTVQALIEGPTYRAGGRWTKLVEGLRLAGLPTA